jgi:hypothetical protein
MQSGTYKTGLVSRFYKLNKTVYPEGSKHKSRTVLWSLLAVHCHKSFSSTAVLTSSAAFRTCNRRIMLAR